MNGATEMEKHLRASRDLRLFQKTEVHSVVLFAPLPSFPSSFRSPISISHFLFPSCYSAKKLIAIVHLWNILEQMNTSYT